MSQLATARDSNVFVNCPFDENYTQFLYVTLFTLWCCGKSPQLTLLDRDSTTPRLNRITKMIWSSNDKNEIPTAHEIWTSYEDYFGRLQNELGIIKFNVVKVREFLDKIPEYITRKT